MANPATDTSPGDVTAPPVPVASAVPYGKGIQIKISMTEPQDFAYYEVHKGTSAGVQTLWQSGRATTWTDLETLYGGTYFYKVRAFDTSGNVSAFSNLTSTTPSKFTGGDIADASIGTAHIIDATITSAKIGDLQVTNAKIGNLQVDTIKMTDGSVITSKIGLNAVTGWGYAYIPGKAGQKQSDTGTVTKIPGTDVNVNIASSSSPIIVSFCSHVGFRTNRTLGGGNDKMDLVIYIERDNVTQVTFTEAMFSVATSMVGIVQVVLTMPINYIDGGLTGTHNWSAYWTLDSNSGSGEAFVDGYNCFLEVVELKR